MTDFIKKLESRENLSFEESKILFLNIMEGTYDENSIIKELSLGIGIYNYICKTLGDIIEKYC